MAEDNARNVDVLVIGCGPAGASAAISAHDEGARVLVVEKLAQGGGNALFAGGFLWDVSGAEAVRHVETLFFGKTDRSVAEAYVRGLNGLRTWIGELGGEAVTVSPRRAHFLRYCLRGRTFRAVTVWSTGLSAVDRRCGGARHCGTYSRRALTPAGYPSCTGMPQPAW